MKRSVTLPLLIASHALLAQNCLHTVHPAQMPDWGSGWNSARIHTSGNVSWSESVLGVSYGLMTPDGQPVWDRHVIHNDPETWMYTKVAQSRSDGGHLINGWISPGWDYESECIIASDPSGSTEWGRSYMTDSTDYGMAACYFQSMHERTDGNTLVAMVSRKTAGLALLGADGVPLWHKRYVTETSDAEGSFALDAVLETDNTATVLAGDGHGGLVIFRTDANGDAQWGYTYPMSETQNPTDMLKAADGSFYVVTGRSSGFVNEGYLLHLNNDGSMDWAKHYGKSLRRIEALPNGDLLVSTGVATTGDSTQLVRVDAAGNALAAWTSNVGGGWHDLIGVRGDSIFVLQGSTAEDYPAWSALTVAVSFDDLSCAFVPSAVPTVTDEPVPVTSGSVITALPDELKSWAMNVGVGVGPGELDVQGFAASGPARPGFDCMLYTVASNLGGATSGPLTTTLTFDPLLTYVEADPEPTSVVGNVVTWSGTPELVGYADQMAWVRLNVPSDPGLIGTVLNHTFAVAQDSTETGVANNATMTTREITGSYDPNDKQVSPRDFYHIANDSILDYTIQFQNTGSDTAFTVVVRDTLPLDVDTRTFKMGTASHPYTYSLTGNGILTFTFENILLPDSNTNEPMSHGLVNFRIKPIQPLSLGQEITNTADIYFDFNPPIHTPAATVVVTDETGVHPTVRTEKLQVFPVPVKGMLNAVLPSGFDPVSAFAIGVDGRRVPVFARSIVNRQAEYRTDHLPSGAYVLTLHDRSGRRMSARFTKE